MRDAEIIITGMGAASALGTGCEAHAEALRTGIDGLRRITRFDTTGFSSQLGGTWPAWDGRVQKEPKGDEDIGADFPVSELALVAAKEAWQQAQVSRALEQGIYDKKRVALLFGTCFGQSFREFHPLAERIAAALELRGICVTISTACSSSTNAIGLARDFLRRGDADIALAGGADVLLREVFAGFSSLGVLSPEKCAPFSEALGTTLGEGAGFFVLERREQAEKRGLLGYASIHGYGLSSDGYHETTPDPSGAGISRAIHGALKDAGWPGDSVDFVSAHATATATNDRIEWTAIQNELGERSAERGSEGSRTFATNEVAQRTEVGERSAERGSENVATFEQRAQSRSEQKSNQRTEVTKRDISVSGSKSQLGHAQGAAGALELLMSILAMRQGLVPPTLHFKTARAGCPTDPNAGTSARPHQVTRALKLSSAFGGANAALAFAPASQSAARPIGTQRSKVVVRGIGVVGPGAGILEDLASLGERRFSGAASALDIRRAAPSVDPRRLDASSRLLVAAASACLEDGGRAAPRGAARARAGLFVGATRMPEESAFRCRESMRLHGAAKASASAFARMSVNSPAGTCSRLLGLFGPSSTVSIGEGSGLFAIALAAEWLATREDADSIVAGAVDEFGPGINSRGGLAKSFGLRADSNGSPKDLANPAGDFSPLHARLEVDQDNSENAACVLLERGEGKLMIAGWGFSGPNDPKSAIEQALAGRSDVTHIFSDGTPTSDVIRPLVTWIDISRWCAYSEATRSALAFAAAVAALRRRTCASALVVTSRSRSANCAVLLTSLEPT